MTNEEFYRECADILGVEYNCVPFPWYKRTRWNHRAPGSGRYEGKGIIRVFGDTIHFSLIEPEIHTTCNGKVAALALLRDKVSE